ncbi:MAG: type II toxin-antitoxin system RelE/ParE family toxin [bacterium]|nr:type II toxin-antitoxin system RelE/ParE family toxin [bacterium]
MKYTFHPEAAAELINSIDYYESQQSNLGLKFLEEIYSSIQRIIKFPSSNPNFSKNTRKCITSKFPFAVIYQIRQEEIFIVAVTHLARKPGYWKDRSRKKKS